MIVFFCTLQRSEIFIAKNKSLEHKAPEERDILRL